MATFPSITPTYSFSKNTAPRVRTVVFGDGFEQRLSYGINQNPKTYSLEFRVSETDSDIIEGFLNSRAFDNESFNFTPPAEGISNTGTYARSGSTVTITITNHGVAIGDKVTLDFTSGSAADGDYIVATSVNQNTFTVITTASGTTNGNVDCTMSGQRKFVCDSFTKTIPSANRAVIQCTFREVFET